MAAMAKCVPSRELPPCRHCTRRATPEAAARRGTQVIDAASVASAGVCCMFDLRLPPRPTLRPIATS